MMMTKTSITIWITEVSWTTTFSITLVPLPAIAGEGHITDWPPNAVQH